MKKIILGLFILTVFTTVSCTERTCPTYAKEPVNQPFQQDVNV